MDGLADLIVAAWQQLPFSTKVGLLAQSATLGLLAAAIHRPSKAVLGAAFACCVLGFVGLSLADVLLFEYSLCGTLEAPTWCGRP